jgi:hypothetical protein
MAKKKKAAPAKKTDAQKQSAAEAIAKRKAARKKAARVEQKAPVQTRPGEAVKPVKKAEARKAQRKYRERRKAARGAVRAADRDVARADYENATDEERAQIDRAKERRINRGRKRDASKQTQARQIIQQSPNKKARKKAERVIERGERRNERQARVDRRQGMNPAEGGTGWNWRWDRDPNTTKDNPTGAPGGEGEGEVDPNEGWVVAETYLLNMGFTPQQVASLKNQLWGPDSDLRLYYDQPSIFGDLVMSRLYETEVFKERFPAVAESRAKNPQDFISVGEVLEYEREWENIMPSSTWGMFPKRETITKLMLGGVSLDELGERVQTATWAAATAPAAIRQQLSERYGIPPDALIGFYLDPQRGEEWLQSETMTAAARASGVDAGIGLTWEQSQALVAEAGLTDLQGYSTLRTRFADAGALRGLQTGYGQTVSGQTLAQSQVADNVNATEQVARAAQGRIGRFNRQAGAAETAEGTIGLRRSQTT